MPVTYPLTKFHSNWLTKLKKILEWKLTLHAQKASLLQEIKVRYTYD